ncbi:sensor histidine kinase [Actinoplanes sp. NPDC020271]|uniref:sensor histidine kinase n=1 Tax=Actinoplanes sp. NPDC020271 TaxID=3363896 RepID=UPI003796C1EB
MTLLYGGLFTVIALGVLGSAQQLQLYVLNELFTADAHQGNDVPCDQRPPDVPCSLVPYDSHNGNAPSGGSSGLRDDLASSQQLITVAAVLVITVLAFGLSWWLTGRLLRPLHRITDTARRLSLSTMHERIALTGAPSELKDLADTFDAMLDRLQDSLDSQRRFVANASHELRTPLAIQRTAIEVGLVDPSPEMLARVRAELLRNVQRAERLIEGLLTLAQGERGLDIRSRVDFAATVNQVISDQQPAAHRNGVTIAAAINHVAVAGDEVMLTRLAANLVQNAVHHNHPGGHVLVELADDATLVVRNTGPQVPPDRLDELFQPFRRLHRDRTKSAEGAGLGLSIVAAIVHAHGGTVQATANTRGGLTVTVALPVLTELALSEAVG